MGARNLLFIGLVVAGIVALRASLFPLGKSRGMPEPRAAAARINELQDVVGQVNAAFRDQWSAEKLQPAPPAPNLTVARRLSLALTGTIPSLEEIRQFEKVPEDQQLAWWLDYLLHDQRFADYFAERLARAYVGTEEGPFLFFRRRRFVTWLSGQLRANRPYNALVRELIVSDGLWTDKPATNFITATFNEGHPDAERLAGRVARAFLGIRLDCAQCHDHPFEAWKQTDFHGLAAFFGRTKQGFTGIYDGSGEHKMEVRKTGAKVVVEPAVPFDQELLPASGNLRQQLAGWLTHVRWLQQEEVTADEFQKWQAWFQRHHPPAMAVPATPGKVLIYNTYFARAAVQRIWALLFNRPLLDCVESMDALADPPRALVLLAHDFAAHRYDLHRLMRVIAATEVFRLDSAADQEITEAHEKAWAVFPLTRLRPEQVVGSVQQAASVRTINAESNLLVRLAYYGGEKEFVQRYGDTGEDEFAGRGGTIPQRLLLMNGDLVKEKTKNDLLNAANLIAGMAPSDRAAVETAFLAVLTRRPSQVPAANVDGQALDEWTWFERRLAGSKGNERGQRLEDLFWALINSTEFSWNH